MSNNSIAYLALVQWYCKPTDLPKRNLCDEKFVFDFDREVIHDCRDSNRIEIETIIDKCSVIEDKTVELKANMYICRYRLVKQEGTRAKYNLLPLNAIISDYNKAPKTPKRSVSKAASEELGTPKLKIKRINSGENFEIVTKAKTPSTKACSIQLEDVLQKSSKKTQVSPFKIVNNSVQKINRIRIDDENSVSPSKKSKNDYYEPNGNYFNIEEVNVDSLQVHRPSQAKRKLTMETKDDLNYSIISEEDLKITLRISHKENTPSRRRPSTDENTQMRRSTRKKSVFEDTPLREIDNNLTPRKNKPIDLGTPRQIITRRKSILKTPGTSDVYGTPKKSVFLNIVEEHPAEIHKTPKRTTKKYTESVDIDEEHTRTPRSSRKSVSKSTPKSRRSLA